jgi:hypothetical protein
MSSPSTFRSGCPTQADARPKCLGPEGRWPALAIGLHYPVRSALETLQVLFTTNQAAVVRTGFLIGRNFG